MLSEEKEEVVYEIEDVISSIVDIINNCVEKTDLPESTVILAIIGTFCKVLYDAYPENFWRLLPLIESITNNE